MPPKAADSHLVRIHVTDGIDYCSILGACNNTADRVMRAIVLGRKTISLPVPRRAGKPPLSPTP